MKNCTTWESTINEYFETMYLTDSPLQAPERHRKITETVKLGTIDSPEWKDVDNKLEANKKPSKQRKRGRQKKKKGESNG
ncbi:hypothetical protein [Radiobacillus sp. PE A8.2]|uniref:hypothetical protein n=1 Tax=Radiobacillus sp. PE A8.2 TaxID=3380349 RepID=UPI0038909085